MKQFSANKKIVKSSVLEEKNITRLTSSQKLEIENANRSGKKTTRQDQEKNDLEKLQYKESWKLREFLIKEGYKETTSNVFNNGDVLIRIIEGKGIDIAEVEDFENWELDKLNESKLYIPQTKQEYEMFMDDVENLLNLEEED